MKDIIAKSAKGLSEEDRSAKAVARYLRIAPRKVRRVIDTIRRQPTPRAFAILATLKPKAARLTEKLLKNAVANAKVLGFDENRLFVSDVRADGGPVLKRFMSRSMGRADRILKRTTHLSLVVTEGSKIWKSGGGLKGEEGQEAEKESGKKKAVAKT